MSIENTWYIFSVIQDYLNSSKELSKNEKIKIFDIVSSALVPNTLNYRLRFAKVLLKSL